ncbi:Sec-independent protein translocase protein TatB [Psychrobacter sp. DM4]|uniref:Sec-independent protein translocase protein TatB n=1 Tax=Psychrobacter sp. DM4 TaxID=3440637 RepID=UPI003F505479
MFDIGFSELLLFGVIALIVLGPEKLPQAARTAGQWYSKLRRTISTLQSEIEAELDLAETRQLMQKELAKIRETEAEMRREITEMRGSMKEFESSQNQSIRTKDGDIKENTEEGSTEQDLSVEPDYSYHAEASQTPRSALSSKTNSKTEKTTQNAQPIITRPWENMWFRLGAYDKARRLPAPPYLPNYQADVLLHIDSSKTSTHKTHAPASITTSEAD